MIKRLQKLSDEQLVERAKKGERAALEALCDRYLPRIYNRLRALLPPEAVEDVTQEVMVALVRGLRRYREESTFRTWISAIARYKVADYYRSRERQPETVTFIEGFHNFEANAAWEERALVRIVLRRLPADYQEVLLLRFAEGLLFRQIGEALDISTEAARSRYRRAVAAMAEELEGYLGQSSPSEIPEAIAET
jgi:RNA polymerase sigma-70 factor (ECF subfamily)